MKSSTFVVVGAIALAAAALSTGASAGILLQDNFDSYADQAAFQAAWPIGGATTTGGTLSNARSVSAPNSVNFPTTAQRNDRSFTESGAPDLTNLIRFSVDFYDSNAAAAPYRQVVQLIDGAGSSSGQLVSLGMNNNQSITNSGGNFYMARILGYTVPTTADPDGGPAESVGGANAFFKLNDYGVGLRSTGWHNLAVEITNVDYKFYVDGALAETVANSGFTSSSTSYDKVRLGSGITSVNEANFDDIDVEVNPVAVPEPSSVALCLLGAAALLARPRRQS
jgi:hypothetical protein